MDPRNLDIKYFFKLAEWIIKAEPGTYPVQELSKDPGKLFGHINWYNICRPKGFKEVCILHDEQINVYEDESTQFIQR